ISSSRGSGGDGERREAWVLAGPACIVGHLRADVVRQLRIKSALSNLCRVGATTAGLLPIASPERAMSKYKNQPTAMDGVIFDSKREAERYAHLKLLERAGY